MCHAFVVAIAHKHADCVDFQYIAPASSHFSFWGFARLVLRAKILSSCRLLACSCIMRALVWGVILLGTVWVRGHGHFQEGERWPASFGPVPCPHGSHEFASEAVCIILDRANNKVADGGHGKSIRSEKNQEGRRGFPAWQLGLQLINVVCLMHAYINCNVYASVSSGRGGDLRKKGNQWLKDAYIEAHLSCNSFRALNSCSCHAWTFFSSGVRGS